MKEAIKMSEHILGKDYEDFMNSVKHLEKDIINYHSDFDYPDLDEIWEKFGNDEISEAIGEFYCIVMKHSSNIKLFKKILEFAISEKI
ncbi:MAG: hypothetical protein ABGX43_03300 [Nitrospinaceae bacterium]|jgi:hypothetical protein|nr:MAG: hypothetical protein CXT68_03580 [Euryarchaeota archaeon]